MFGKRLPPVSIDEDKIDELTSRGVEEIIPSVESLKALLRSGKRLRIKLGIDPTSPNLHLGRSVPLLKLRDFQELGHQVVFIIGDATGVVGDTSDKDAERPMLTEAQVAENLKNYVSQVSKILDPKLMEVRRNSEWLLKLTYRDIGEHADNFSVADFTARDNIQRRLDQGKRVSLREVLYPLMQGYDSVAVNADVELGGTDQRFNLLAGRTLQERNGQSPQHILMTELIAGTDGRKMSSSWGNTVNLSEEPWSMFEKVMKVDDELTKTYFSHLTRVPAARVEEMMRLGPVGAKLALAKELVRMYHSDAAAQNVLERYTKIASGEVPEENVKEIAFSEGQTYTDVLVASGYGSRTNARRLIEGRGVYSKTKDAPIAEWNGTPEDGEVLRLGKNGIFIKAKRSN